MYLLQAKNHILQICQCKDGVKSMDITPNVLPIVINPDPYISKAFKGLCVKQYYVFPFMIKYY